MAVGRVADYTASIPQIWSDGLFSQAENMTFFNNMEGAEGSSMPIIRKDQLNSQAGDTIKTDIVLALTGAGLTGDTALSLLEGNEEALKFRQLAFEVDSLQHAVRWTKLAQKLITHDMRKTAQNQLAKWLAGKLDDQIFAELSGAGSTTLPTTAKWFAGTATSRDTIEDTDTGGRLTLDTLTELKAFAQVENKIEPVKTDDGNEYFYFVAHPYAVMQLKRDDDKWAQAQREAQVRGAENPLFTGAAGVWDGMIIRSSNRVRRSLNDHATTDIQVADNLLLGAQAMVRGYGSYPDWTEEYFSYGQEAGIATWTLVGNKLAAFDLTSAGGAAAAAYTAIGSMVVYTSAVAPTA